MRIGMFGVAVLASTCGCASLNYPGFSLPKDERPKAEAIQIIETKPERPHTTLGHMKERFDAPIPKSEVKRMMQWETRAVYGDQVDALIDYSVRTVWPVDCQLGAILWLCFGKEVRASAVDFTD